MTNIQNKNSNFFLENIFCDLLFRFCAIETLYGLVQASYIVTVLPRLISFFSRINIFHDFSTDLFENKCARTVKVWSSLFDGFMTAQSVTVEYWSGSVGFLLVYGIFKLLHNQRRVDDSDSARMKIDGGYSGNTLRWFIWAFRSWSGSKEIRGSLQETSITSTIIHPNRP